MTAAADLIGQAVIAWDLTNGSYTYGGPVDGAAYTRMSFDVRTGTSTLFCDADRVAPADLTIPAKDPRVTVDKMPATRSYSDAGVWRLTVDGKQPPGPDRWYKTRKAAIAAGLRLVAIRDWHAMQVTV